MTSQSSDPSDPSSKPSASALAIGGEHRFRAENLPFGIDVWYRPLSIFTYKTYFIPLSLKEAKAIIAFYQFHWNNKHQLKLDHLKVLLELEQKVERKIQIFKLNEKIPPNEPLPLFIRLTDRSPKDGEPLNKHIVWKQYQTQLANLLELKKKSSNNDESNNSNVQDKANPPDSKVSLNWNDRLNAIGKVSFLKIENASECLSLILTSERIFADLNDWILYGEPAMIALREFDKEILLEHEYRAFVCKNRLTAITQYDHYTYYPNVPSLRSKVGPAIYHKWSELHPHIGVSAYCIDFVYHPNTNTVTMIEMSPFTPCTGPATYNWKNDLALLRGEAQGENGYTIEGVSLRDTKQQQQSSLDGPTLIYAFDFRVLTEPRNINGFDDVLDMNWDDRWTAPHNKYFQTYYRLLESHGIKPFKSEGESNVWESVKSSFKQLFNSDKNEEKTSYKLNKVSGEIEAEQLISEWNPQAINYYLNQVNRLIDNNAKDETDKKNKKSLLFVYGTLKDGFQWHEKFLSEAQLISKEASTVNKYILFLGESAVPYLMDHNQDDRFNHEGLSINGEIYQVDQELLDGMDDYEGVTKNYYERRAIQVSFKKSSLIQNDLLLNQLNSYIVSPQYDNAANNDNNEDQEIIIVNSYVYILPADRSKQFNIKSDESEYKQIKIIQNFTKSIHDTQYNPIKHIQIKQNKYLNSEDDLI